MIFQTFVKLPEGANHEGINHDHLVVVTPTVFLGHPCPRSCTLRGLTVEKSGESSPACHFLSIFRLNALKILTSTIYEPLIGHFFQEIICFSYFFLRSLLNVIKLLRCVLLVWRPRPVTGSNTIIVNIGSHPGS